MSNELSAHTAVSPRTRHKPERRRQPANHHSLVVVFLLVLSVGVLGVLVVLSVLAVVVLVLVLVISCAL